MPVDAKPLFRPDVLRPHVDAYALPPHVEQFRPKLEHWAELIRTDRINNFRESEILPDFLTDFFVTLLGYTGPAGGATRYTISRERHVEVDGKFADAVLGDFNGAHRFTVALEGKGPKDPLDRAYAGRRMSAVDQGYRYAINLPCDWIIVTSTRETRLYHKGSDQHTYERFDTYHLFDDEPTLRRFVFLLGANRVVPFDGRCHLYDLLAESEKVGRQVTKDYYVQYADMREDAFEQLSRDNAQVPRPELLASTQKLLDRVLFVAFAEDRGLLPADTIQKAFEHRDPYNPKPVWDNFRGLFGHINRGNAALGIHAYNGGLFADDQILDRLKVSDEVCEYFYDLGKYDYRPAQRAAALADDRGQLIDVDILGHIFEQSISDLEKLRNELEGLVAPVGPERHRSRRRQEGAFYTPTFITRYIIEQALGGVVRDRFEQLRKLHEEKAVKGAKPALGEPRVYNIELLKSYQKTTSNQYKQLKALTGFWEAWQEELATIRILDPACGSGAFLIEAFDQLYEIYQEANSRLLELRGPQRELTDLNKQILQNNLYGVDLNDEAIEICRLSLWIKTAERGKTLTSLDHSIRVGNSVVDHPSVHPKAFDWQAAFPEVFRQGGFDLVIGNPPYIRQGWIVQYKPHWEEAFNSYHGTADIFVYFFELGLRLLRDNGKLAFITSGSWVRGRFGAPLRTYILANANIESMIDFGEYQPFEDAEMIRPTIAVLRKERATGKMRLFRWLTSGHPPENLSEVITASDLLDTGRLGSAAWELESDSAIALRQKLSEAPQTLGDYANGRILYGIKTGLTEVYAIEESKRQELVEADPKCAEIIRPFIQGTNMRPWYTENPPLHLIALKSSNDYSWPWADANDNAEELFRVTYPSIHAYLAQHEARLKRRSDQGKYWWELRTCAYWDVFDREKVLWPDITNRPRCSMEVDGVIFGDTAFMAPGKDCDSPPLSDSGGGRIMVPEGVPKDERIAGRRPSLASV